MRSARSPRGSPRCRCRPSPHAKMHREPLDRPAVSSTSRDHALRIGRRKIDLVDDRDDRRACAQRQMIVRQRLRLDALRGVDHQQRAFARRERARDFVGEIDVAGRVDEVELVQLAVVGAVVQRDRMRLDRDAAFALEIHRSRAPAPPSSRAAIVPVISSSRSESVVLPWSICAMMQKLRTSAFVRCAPARWVIRKSIGRR